MPLRLKAGTFDPLVAAPAELLLGDVTAETAEAAGLYLVQFCSPSDARLRKMITDQGAKILNYMPERAHVVSMTPRVAKLVSGSPAVRWTGRFTSNFKLSPEIMEAYVSMSPIAAATRYDVVLFDKETRETVIDAILALGGSIARENRGSVLLEALMTPTVLRAVAAMPEIAWIQAWTEIGVDIDKARILGGADSIARAGSTRFTGVGIRGHVLEGITPSHGDFAATQLRNAPIAIENGATTSHGQQTYGIVFGSGAGRASARGMLPNAQGFYTNFDYVYDAAPGSRAVGSRYELVGRLINDHQVMFQTASWGYTQVTAYDARSLEMDDIIFHHDIPITQSQSNTGTTSSRPQAWAKNIISVGAVYHNETVDMADDRWNRSGSIGPATDGRIKPDLSAFYDKILTTTETGYTENFGGTSGATPIVAGHVGLTIEMWTDGIFGNPLPGTTRFENRPHFSTTKALLINTAKQWQFSGATHDLTRVHQGWGFPDLAKLYDQRERMLVVNESDVLEGSQSKTYRVVVANGTPELRATMVFADPPGSVSSTMARVNDLDLMVTAPDGTVYFGNNGLLAAKFSTPGGDPNRIDTVENVFVENPAAGVWTITVGATEVNADGHLETSEDDVDYALVVNAPSL